MGEGSIQNKLLTKLGLTDIHKEIVMVSAPDEVCDKLYEMFVTTQVLSKRNKGIAFSIPFISWSQVSPQEEQKKTSAISNNTTHLCIMVIVDKGRGRDCMTSARAAGAQGSTLIHARGAGIPADFYFPLTIEPQKDIVMIILPIDKAPVVQKRILSDLNLEKTGHGIMFTLPVNRTIGLVENRNEDNRGKK